MTGKDDPLAPMQASESDARPGRGLLTSEEFARRFSAAGRLFWTIAAGVLGDRGEVEDVLQEACMLALGKLDDYRSDDHFHAWMGRFVQNAARNHARKRQRRATRPAAPDEMLRLVEDGPGRLERSPGASQRAHGEAERLPIDAGGELVADQTDFDDRTLAALQELAPVARAALLLRVTHDLSYREIAELLNVPEGTAMSHVSRSRRALRESLFGADQTTNPQANGRAEGER